MTSEGATNCAQGHSHVVMRRKCSYVWELPARIPTFLDERLQFFAAGQHLPMSETSPVFTDEESGNKWTVHIDFSRQNPVNVSLKLTPSKTCKIHAFFEVTLTGDGCRLSTAVGSHTFTDEDSLSPSQNLYTGPTDNGGISSLQPVYRPRQMTIVFTVEAEERQKPAEVALKQSERKLLLNLSRDLLPLRESRCFSDVVLKVDGEEIPAHRCILSRRSQYFATMLTSGFKEGRDNPVEITDFSASAIEKLVDFMYTARIPDFTIDSAYELLMASDKYDVVDLKSCCADFLGNALSCATAIETLRYSDMCNAKELKEKALRFICQNVGQFEGAEAFAVLQELRPNLLAEILGFMSVVRKKN